MGNATFFTIMLHRVLLDMYSSGMHSKYSVYRALRTASVASTILLSMTGCAILGHSHASVGGQSRLASRAIPGNALPNDCVADFSDLMSLSRKKLGVPMVAKCEPLSAKVAVGGHSGVVAGSVLTKHVDHAPRVIPLPPAPPLPPMHEATAPVAVARLVKRPRPKVMKFIHAQSASRLPLSALTRDVSSALLPPGDGAGVFSPNDIEDVALPSIRTHQKSGEVSANVQSASHELAPAPASAPAPGPKRPPDSRSPAPLRASMRTSFHAPTQSTAPTKTAMPRVSYGGAMAGPTQ